MTRVVVLGFEGKEQAEAARAVAGQLKRDGALALIGAAVGWRDAEGEVHIDHAVPLARTGATTGALAGGIVGLFLLAPLLGLVLGAAAGTAGGQLSELGLDEFHRKDIVRALEPGHAALFVLAEGGDAERVAQALRPHHATVIETTLPELDERRLIRMLGGEPSP